MTRGRKEVEKLERYTESGEKKEGCSAGGGKQQDGLRRGFDECVYIYVCVCVERKAVFH